MITKKELLEKIYADGSLAECWNNLKQWAESLPDDQPATIPFQWPVPDGYEVVTREWIIRRR